MTNKPDILTVQGSEEWHAQRLGRATASNFSKILSTGEKTRSKYLKQLAFERITGEREDRDENEHMARGKRQEPVARKVYVEKTGNQVQEVGFIPHPELMAGCSPDGLIGDDGGIEIKCVLPEIQTKTILRGGYPFKHKAQIQGCLWITGRSWWDFVSYSPFAETDFYCFRVNRDEEYISNLAREVAKFLDELQKIAQV